MILIRSPDKFIIGCIHQIPDIFDLPGHLVYKFLWRYSGFRSLQLDLLPVLVSSGLEEYIEPPAPFVPGDRICQHRLISISDVRLSRCVGNRCRNVILLLFH